MGSRSHILEHRLVAEQITGRPLFREETVHHINGDPSDNRIENLEIMSRATHRKLHAIEIAKRNGYDIFTQKRCPGCKKIKARTEFTKRNKKTSDEIISRCKPCKAKYQRERGWI